MRRATDTQKPQRPGERGGWHRALALGAPCVCAAALLVWLWLPAVLDLHSTVIGGERYYFLYDDSMISMRYAHNLARGFGPVWNPGERVEGYTNPLWVAYMALIHLLPVPLARTSLPVMLTNVALAAATLVPLASLVRRLGGGLAAVALALLAFALCSDSMIWAVEGFETPLLTLAVTAAVSRLLREADAGRPRPATFLLLGLFPLIRSDAFVLTALCGALALALAGRSGRRRVWPMLGLALLLPAAQEAFRVGYYHDWLPNAAYLKVTGWPGRTAAGIGYVRGFLGDYTTVVGLAVLSALLGGRAGRLLLGLLACFCGYVAYAGGDAFWPYRFLAPVLPLWFALAFTASAHLARWIPWPERVRLPGRPRPPLPLSWRTPLRREDWWRPTAPVPLPRVVPGLATVGLGLWLGVVCLTSVPWLLTNYSAHRYAYVTDADNIRMGLWFRDHTPAGARVCDFWAGTPPYFSDRYAIDPLGKCDPHIAREGVASAGTKPGHNKFDFDYTLLAERPDYFVASYRFPQSESTWRRASQGDYAFNGLYYYNAAFREHCLPYPVNADLARTIFRCR